MTANNSNPPNPQRQMTEQEKILDILMQVEQDEISVYVAAEQLLSDRDQFAIGFATSLLELDNVPLTEDGKQKLKVKFDLYKQSLTKTDKK